MSEVVQKQITETTKIGGRDSGSAVLIDGDDWGWPGVRAAVEKFSQDHDLHVRLHEENHWILRKATP